MSDAATLRMSIASIIISVVTIIVNLVMLTFLLVLLLPVPASAEPVLYTSLTEHDGILDVDGYEFYFRDVIPSTPQFLYEAPPILFFTDWTYYDDLWLPGATAPSAWVYRWMQPVDDETMLDASGRLLYVEHDYEEYAHNDPVGVPEPSTLMLLGLGMAGLFVMRKRPERSLNADGWPLH